MTLDELAEVYHKAASNVPFLQYEGPSYRAGIRAVVAALREEIVPTYWKLNHLSIVQAEDLRRFFNELLGAATDE